MVSSARSTGGFIRFFEKVQSASGAASGHLKFQTLQKFYNCVEATVCAKRLGAKARLQAVPGQQERVFGLMQVQFDKVSNHYGIITKLVLKYP